MAPSSSNLSKIHKKSKSSTSLMKRQVTLFKKAYELSTLCAIEVCVICYEPNGMLKTWPEDIEVVKDMARRYCGLSELMRRKGSVDLREFLEKINKDDSKNSKKVRLGSNFKYSDWDPRFDEYSLEQCMEVIQSLELNQTRFNQRIQALVEGHQIVMTNHVNIHNQAQKIKTSATVNHLQQYPNHVSMLRFKDGNISASTSGFNQEQSLASIPSQLKVYPNFNVENHSELREQEIGTNEFQTANIYNNNSTLLSLKAHYCNMNAGGYSALIGMQGTGLNGVQNINMSTSNFKNTNVESNLKSLGVQGTGLNRFQNINMSNFNNTNVESYLQLLGVQGTNVNGLRNTDKSNFNNMNMNVESYLKLLGAEETEINKFQNNFKTRISGPTLAKNR